ncbi:MAG: Rieske (2Fe-2S) protein [Bacteroidia bacterium]
MYRKTYIRYFLFFAVGALLGLSSCHKNTGDNLDPIPNTPVSLTINLDLPAYFDLTLSGNFMYFVDGYKGLIVYHGFDDQYYAFDRACSYQPTNACSQLWMDSTTNMHMICGSYPNGIYEKCCDSRFELPSGLPVQGPATFAMKQYYVSRSGNTLYVTN